MQNTTAPAGAETRIETGSPDSVFLNRSQFQEIGPEGYAKGTRLGFRPMFIPTHFVLEDGPCQASYQLAEPVKTDGRVIGAGYRTKDGSGDFPRELVIAVD